MPVLSRLTALALACMAPAWAQTPAMPLAYQSPLANYQRFEDPPAKAWQEANQNVGRIGGWRAYAREQAGEAKASGEAKAPAPKPEAAGHGHHHGGHGMPAKEHRP